MVQQITNNALSLANQTVTKNNIILTIKGIPFVFGSLKITSLWKIGDPGVVIGQQGLTIGGTIELPNSRPYISLKGTTNNITSQIEVDRGGGQSVQKMNIVMVDKNDELTTIFKPGENIPDLLGAECEVFLLFEGGLYPEDTIRIFSGNIDSHSQGAGQWKLSVAHPDKVKETEIFEQTNTELTSAVDDVVTTFTLNSTANLILPGADVDTYLVIDDEIVRYTGISGNDITGISRGQFGTIAASHDADASVTSQYYLNGNAIDLALKVMLSNRGNTAYEVEVPAVNFNQVAPTEFRANSFLVSNTRFQQDHNLRLGDLITTTGSVIPANNVTEQPITNFEVITDGTIITVGGTAVFVDEVGSDALADFKSQYNVLPAGCGLGMNPRQVDIDQHEAIFDTFGAPFPDYSIPIKDTITGKELLTNEIYFPTGLINVPRGGRSSVVYTTPPLVLDTLVRLTEDNIENPDKLEIKRSINKNFYNSTVYRFAEDAVETKFLAGEIIISNKSAERIDTGNKSLRIDSKGFQDNAGTRSFIATQARRYNDRFQFAAETIKVEPLFSGAPGDAPTFNLDVGDTVLFGSPGLKVNDLEQGTREFTPRLFEIVNKSLNLKNNKVSLTLLDTKQGIDDARFGSISPSSFTDSGSSTVSLKLKPSFGVTLVLDEREKWRDFIGDKIRVRNSDYTFVEDVTLVQFDPGDSSRLTILPLSSAPPEDYIIDLPDYPTGTDSSELATMKGIHCFFTPQVEVVSGISSTQFTVAVGDIGKFIVNGFVRVHNDDFTVDSQEDLTSDNQEVTDIDTGTNTVTVEDLGFVPAAGYKVDLIGFPDGGDPYRLI